MATTEETVMVQYRGRRLVCVRKDLAARASQGFGLVIVWEVADDDPSH